LRIFPGKFFGRQAGKALGADQNIRVAKQGRLVGAGGRIKGWAVNGQIELAGAEGFFDPGRNAGTQLHRLCQRGRCRNELGPHDARKTVRHDHAQDLARLTFGVARARQKAADLAHQRRQIAGQNLACRGQGQGPCVAFEKRHAQAGLQPLKMLRYRRLRKPKRGRRSRQTWRLNNGKETCEKAGIRKFIIAHGNI